MRVTALALLALTASGSVAAQRRTFSMDPGWRFALGDHQGAERPGFNDSRWRVVELPHDWSIEGIPREDAPAGGRGGFFPTGIGWYRKTFRLPAGQPARPSVLLEFEGIYMNGEVWVNGTRLGLRPFGYIAHVYDITKHLKSGNNVVAVRVDNSRQPNSRWYTGSGITRRVWLTLRNPLHVGHWGTFVTTPRADSGGAEVVARTRIENDGTTPRSGVLRSTIIDPAGRLAGRIESTFSLAPGGRVELEGRVTVDAPRLWSVESPNLYRLQSEVLVGRDTLDLTHTTFGIRSIAYDARRGFLLNGRRVKMLGVNLHHDAGALGAAVPEGVWERRLALLKAMGANAIRTAHNPPDPRLLDLADRLGFLVMDEVFDEWTIGKVPEGYHKYFAEWSERDVRDFIRRDRNHPSVVLWSAGNEIGEQSRPEGVAVLQRLLDVFHREDPTRPVTTGNDQIYADNTPATKEFLNALDIVGYNYVDRWHERREIFAEQDRLDHPEWKMIGTESGSIFQSLDEQYSLGDDPAKVQPNYTSGMLTAERLWKWITMRDWFAGNFMWTGIDYLGEATWPFKGFASGPLDITGHPKDAYYLYQSLWSREPVLRLFPHWNWPGREGQVIPVLAYSRCHYVELFLNGRSLGEKRMEFPSPGTSGGWNTYAEPRVHPTTNDLHLSWDVPYEPGVLKAVGRTRDGKTTCAAETRTAGPAAAIRLTPYADSVTTTLGEVAHVTFEIVDSAGIVVPTATNQVHVSVTGDGKLLVLDNADLRAHSAREPGTIEAYNGRGLAILKATRSRSKPGTRVARVEPDHVRVVPEPEGVIEVTASAPGLRSATIRIRSLIGPSPGFVPAAR
jgi:beta-galactosidase